MALAAATAAPQLAAYANGATRTLETYPNGATVPVEPEFNRAQKAAFIDAVALGLLYERDPAAAAAAVAASNAKRLPYFAQTRTVGYASGESFLDNPVNPAWAALIADKINPALI